MEAFPLQWPTDWPRTKYPGRSRFGKYNDKPTIAKSRDFLFDELKRMGANSVVLSTNLELRNDGLPYSNQKNPVDKGVAIYFQYNKQSMAIACDTFDNIGCNIYAIGKTIEAMRGIDRWGCSELMNRAFTGFKALPAQGNAIAKPWWQVFDLTPTASYDEVKSAYREKAKKFHPDHGGTPEEFHIIQKAYEEYEESI